MNRPTDRRRAQVDSFKYPGARVPSGSYSYIVFPSFHSGEPYTGRPDRRYYYTHGRGRLIGNIHSAVAKNDR